MASSSWRHPGDVHLEQRGALGRAELVPGDVEDAAHRNAADRGGSRGVAGTRARPEAGGPLGRIEANQGPLVDEQLGEPIAPLVAAVAPQDPLGGGGGGEALDESKQVRAPEVFVHLFRTIPYSDSGVFVHRSPEEGRVALA